MAREPMSPATLRSYLSREEVRQCLEQMARDACEKLGGYAEIGDGFYVIDTKVHPISMAKPTVLKVLPGVSGIPEPVARPKKKVVKKKKAVKKVK